MPELSAIASTNARPGEARRASRLKTLDFLRGLAILGVVAIHAAQNFPSHVKGLDFLFLNGWVGVQIFFFVSAFTMCHMWRQREGEARPILNFYIRRVLRIAPPFWIAIPVYLAFEGFGPSFFAPHGVGPWQITLTALFLHGLWPDAINSVVPGGWSIAVEMTFYAAFPFLILAFGADRFAYLRLAIAVFLVNALLLKSALSHAFLAGAFAGCADLVEFFAHNDFPTQAPIFLVGCFLFFSLEKPLGWATAGWVALWIGLGALADHVVPVREFHYLLIYLGLAVFVYAALKLQLSSPAIEFFGRHSYAIYLAHFLVLEALSRLLPVHQGVAALLFASAATALISAGVARFSEKFVEGPSRKLAARLTRVAARESFAPAAA